MDKDITLLTGVSKLFTERILEQIISTKFNHTDVSITGWNFAEASAKGDSYLSTVDRVCIEGIVNGKPERVKIVVKSLPQNLGRRKTYRSPDFFRNEIIFYSKIVPVFKRFLEAKGQPRLFLVPTCLAYVLDGENDFIALEDVSVDGFGPASRQTTLNVEECQLILRGMARFHGVSLAHQDQYKEEFYEVAGQLEETYFSDEYWEWYRKFHQVLINIARDAITKEYPGSPEAKKFCSIEGRELWERSRNICARRRTPTSVINQGDAWAPNFLIRTDESTGEKEALLLDFQLARWAGPVSDLSFFIYSCTDKKMRDENFQNFLEYYHQELSKTITNLGSDAQKVYPWELFQNEIKAEFVHGLNFSLESIQFSALSEDEAFDLDIINDDKAVNIADVWTLKPIEDSEKRRRLADAIIHAISHDFL